MENWTVRRTTCTTIHTHKDVTLQIIVDHNKGTITWGNKTFDTVKDAKKYVEENHENSSMRW